jgi:dihydrolipoamide dehydrogenase
MFELGLYPNQSIIKISSSFDYLKHASDYGLTVSSFDKDFSAVVQQNGCIRYEQRSSILMKKNKIDVLDGFGKLKPGKK